MGDEINELQKEWRAIVLEKLSSLEEGQHQMRNDIVDIKTSFARQAALEDLRKGYEADRADMQQKIDELNAFKYKLIGISVAINVILFPVIEYVLLHK